MMTDRSADFLRRAHFAEEAKKYDTEYFEQAFNFPTDERIDELARLAFSGLYSKEARDTLLRIYRSRRFREKVSTYEGCGLWEHEDVSFGDVQDHQDFPPNKFTVRYIEEDEIWEEMKTADQDRLFELTGSDFHSVRIEAMKRLTDQELLYRIAAGKAAGDRESAAAKLTDDEKLRDAVMENSGLLQYKHLRDRIKDKSVFRHYAQNGNSDEQLYALLRLQDDARLAEIAVSETTEYDCLLALGGMTDQKRICDVVLNAQHERIRKAALKEITEQELLADIVMRTNDFLIELSAMEGLYDQACLAKVALNGGRGDYLAIQKLRDAATLVTLMEKDILPQTAFDRLRTICENWQEYLTMELVETLIARNKDHLFPAKGDMAILREIYQAGLFHDVLKKYETEPFRPRMKSDKNDPGLHVDLPEVWLFDRRFERRGL
ncbi:MULTISPECIES: hypothetical protein [Dehalobacter]|jgi:hypothetical protein|nr:MULTISPECIES: hypothetical protein [Dehalobacter]MDJ0304870.1 hypothetical protein [Dehalobacter sp.]